MTSRKKLPSKAELATLRYGDPIEAELRSGQIIKGTFGMTPIGDDCILNQYGFPINYKRITKIL